MTADTAVPYTLRSIEAMLRMSRSTITRLVNARFVTPTRGPRNEYRFTFQDVVLLRTAYHLQQAQVPPRRLLRALKQLRAKLPAEMPLSGLRIQAVGDRVAVRQGDAAWEPETGQLLMDFEVAAADGSVFFMEPGHRPAEPVSAADWFERGAEREATDRDAAIEAYRRAVAIDPEHVGSWINLGALLCEAGRCQEALALYERAAGLALDDPSVHFNGALALEDLGLLRDAVNSYERCLQLAPYSADAHHNAARLCEKLGDAQGMLRHYSAYRRLQRTQGPDA